MRYIGAMSDLTLEQLRAELAPLRAELAGLRAQLEAIQARGKRRPLIPNAETVAAMEAARRGEFTFSGSVEEFRTHLRTIANADDDANG